MRPEIVVGSHHDLVNATDGGNTEFYDDADKGNMFNSGSQQYLIWWYRISVPLLKYNHQI